MPSLLELWLADHGVLCVLFYKHNYIVIICTWFMAYNISYQYVFLITYIYIVYAGVSGRVLRVQAGAHRVSGSHVKHT